MNAKKKLCIAMFMSKFPIYSETFISRKIDYLLTQAHDVHVFCAEFNLLLSGAEKYKTIVHKHVFGHRKIMMLFRYLRNILKIIFYSPSDLTKLFTTLQASYVLSELAAASFFSTKWDIIHCHYLDNMGIVEMALKYFQCPVLVSIYGYDVSVFPYESEINLEKAACWLSQVDGLTYSSEFLRSITHQLVTVQVPESIIWPEVPINLFHLLNKQKCHTPCRILSVGRLDWSKGYPFAMRTMKILFDQGIDFQYHIIGDGYARVELEHTIRMLGLQEHIKLLGRKTPDEVVDAMKWADIFFLCSIREDFGLVLAEAQACGLPIVASRVGGTSEATSEGETSLLVEAGNPQAFADAIYKLIEDQNLYQKMSAQGPIFSKKFDLQESGRKLEEFYYRCINNFHHRHRSRGPVTADDSQSLYEN